MSDALHIKLTDLQMHCLIDSLANSPDRKVMFMSEAGNVMSLTVSEITVGEGQS